VANNLAAFDAEVWSKSLVTKLDQVNVMLRLVNRDWEGDLRQAKTVNIRTAGNITLAPYTKGTAITYEDLAPVKEQFTVNDAEYFAFSVEDIDAAQNDLNALEVYTARAAVGMSNTVETKLLSPYSQVPLDNVISSSSVVTGGAGAFGATVNPLVLDSSTASTGNQIGVYSMFVKARTKLSKQHVPMMGRWAVVSPDEVALLLEDTAHFVRATDLGDAVVQSGTLGDMVSRANDAPGFVGRCAGFDVYECTQLPFDSAGHYCMFGDRWFISYAAQITEIEPLRLQTQFANAIRGLMLHDTFVAAECAKRGVVAYVGSDLD
jgi:hypothetical protein